MDYEEKSALEKEIKTSTKRSIKSCIVASIGTLVMEVIIWGFLFLMLRKYEDIGMFFWAGITFLGLRYLQGLFIIWFAAE